MPRHLHGDAIGHGVGKGHAQLDDVGASGGQTGNDRIGGSLVGVAAITKETKAGRFSARVFSKRLSMRVVMAVRPPCQSFCLF